MPAKKHQLIVRSAKPLLTVRVNPRAIAVNDLSAVIYVHVETLAGNGRGPIVNIGSTDQGYLNRASHEKITRLAKAGVYEWHTDCFFRCREPAAFRKPAHRFDTSIAYFTQVEAFLTDLWALVNKAFPVGNSRQGGFGPGAFMRVGILTFLRHADIIKCLTPQAGPDQTQLINVLRGLDAFLKSQRKCQLVYARRRGRKGATPTMRPRARVVARGFKYGNDVCGLSFDQHGSLTGIGYPRSSTHLYDPDVSKPGRGGREAFFPTTAGMKDLQALAKLVGVNFLP